MRLLMVCLGNICRSPLAEGIFRHRAEQAGLNCVIDSAGTAAYHVGKAPDARAVQVANIRGIGIAGLRARQLRPSDADAFDQIYVMDGANLLAANQILNNPASQHSKVAKVTSLISPSSKHSGIDVPDPYYGSIQDFEAVFGLLELAADGWIRSLTDRNING